MKKSQKGFTLVELVIVIAVIAVLAAVLLPTFANVIESAKESARYQQVVNAQKELITPDGFMPEDTIGFTLCIDDNYYEIMENFSLKKIRRKVSNGLIAVESTISNPNVILYRVPVIGQDFDHGVVYRNSEGYVTVANFDESDMLDEFCDIIEDKVYLKTEYTNQIMAIGFPAGVTKIGNDGFRYCSKLETVIFNDDLVEIGENAFRACYKIKNIDIPDSVKVIDTRAFYYCTSVETLNIPKHLTYIGDYCFGYLSSLKELTLPGTMYKTGDSTFHGCHTLKKLVIEEGITAIDYDCFAACHSLEEIYFPSTLVSIGRGCFWENFSLKEVNFPSSLRSIGNYAFQNCYNLTHITIPDGVTSLSHNLFNGCSNLVSVELPDTIKTIYTYTFANCTSLVQITIPKSVTSIGDMAFTNCYRLFEVFNYSAIDMWPIDKTVTSSNSTVNRVGRLTRNANIVHNITTDGDNVTDVIHYKLYDGEYNDSVINRGHSLPSRNYVESMLVAEDNVYYWVIDDNNAGIHEKMAVGLVDSYAREVNIVEGCTFIRKYAFGDYVNVLKITIPSTITKVNNSGNSIFENLKLYEVYAYSTSFYDYSAKKSINLSSMATVRDNNIYTSGVESKLSVDNGVVYYTSGLDKYAVRTATDDFENLVLANDCTIVDTNAFRDNCFITSAIIPSSVKTLNLNAFKRCYRLKTVNMTNGLVTIENSAFQDCDSLMSISIPDTTIIIKPEAFASCRTLTDITLGSGLQVIDSKAFKGCASIEVIIMGAGVTDINSEAFVDAYIDTIYYSGSLEDWNNINISETDNTAVTDRDSGANLYYYSDTNQENSWHYVNNIPTVWN